MATISEAEKLRRHRINESVIGTHVMEGLPPDARTLALLKQYEEGELSGEQLSAALNAYAHSIARESSMAGVA